MNRKHRRIWKAEAARLALGWTERVRQRRYYRAWASSLASGRSPIADEVPWLTFAAIDRLAGLVTSDMRVFEYGGGGSTLFFARRAAAIVTVEHDERWFSEISEAIRARGLSNWRGILAPPEQGGASAAEIADPEAYVSDDADCRGKQFRRYAGAIDAFPDGHFDVVVVDGRARPSCLAHGIPKVKPGGLLVLDNSDRAYYLERTRAPIERHFETVLDVAGPAPYLAGFSRTTIWKKR